MKKTTLNCNGKLVDVAQPKVMGILNVTPDSFYDGGKYASEKAMLHQVERMLKVGADFIDVGGYSSRANAQDILPEEELQRVVPVIQSIIQHFPNCLLSVDTFRAMVAKAAVEAGAVMVNDISAGLLDETMIPTVAKLQVPYVMMHMRGTPQTMTQATDYNDLLRDILHYFSERIAVAREAGIRDLILDPGFGFAKTAEQNFELLAKMEVLDIANLPILVGVSRKSMVYKTLDIKPEEALNGTTVLNTVALLKGAKILRVHDVAEAVECVTLYTKLTKYA